MYGTRGKPAKMDTHTDILKNKTAHAFFQTQNIFAVLPSWIFLDSNSDMEFARFCSEGIFDDRVFGVGRHAGLGSGRVGFPLEDRNI